MVDAEGTPYPHTKVLYEALQALSVADLDERGAVRARSFLEQGITFSSSGREWVFPLDLIPRLVSEEEWEQVEAGVAPRPASGVRTGSGSTWRASTWCAAATGCCGCWRTTCACRPGSPTWWKTGRR